eukprot:9192681-Karenia_brevis.AAC.1
MPLPAVAHGSRFDTMHQSTQGSVAAAWPERDLAEYEMRAYNAASAALHRLAVRARDTAAPPSVGEGESHKH